MVNGTVYRPTSIISRKILIVVITVSSTIQYCHTFELPGTCSMSTLSRWTFATGRGVTLGSKFNSCPARRRRRCVLPSTASLVLLLSSERRGVPSSTTTGKYAWFLSYSE